MKKSFINKESILVFIFFGFSIISPLFSYGNFWYYISRVIPLSFLSYIIIYSFSFAKSKSIWGFLRVFGISLSAIFLFEIIYRMYLILDPKNKIFFESSNPIDDERFVKFLFAFLSSLLVLGVGEIIIYLRDIRFLLSLNKNNKDYFECDDCYGKGFIEKEEDDELDQKNCENCSGLGFLEKNSNNWFPRK
jgi:hypothetical protein